MPCPKQPLTLSIQTDAHDSRLCTSAKPDYLRGAASQHAIPATLSQLLWSRVDEAGLEDGPKSFGPPIQPFLTQGVPGTSAPILLCLENGFVNPVHCGDPLNLGGPGTAGGRCPLFGCTLAWTVTLCGLSFRCAVEGGYLYASFFPNVIEFSGPSGQWYKFFLK